jgi:ribosomal protein S18 acetylase RimI-like enzyme
MPALRLSFIENPRSLFSANGGAAGYRIILVPECRILFDLVHIRMPPMLPASLAAAPRRPGRAPRATPAGDGDIDVRAVRRTDLDQVIAIDTAVTGLEKRAYWTSVYRRYGTVGRGEQKFLVALVDGRVVGYVIGEVRDWEFGSPPCGWVFAISVDPQVRLAGIGTRLLEAISAVFRRAGVKKLRTLLARDNTLILSFFRSQGLMAGPLLSLERDLGP